MLVLTRRKDQSIMIGDDIEISVLEVKGDQVKIGISAPRDVGVYRKEIFLEIKAETKTAMSTGTPDLGIIAEMLEKSRDDAK